MNTKLVTDQLRQQFIAMNFPTLIDVAREDYNVTEEFQTKKLLIEELVAIEYENMMK